ncbi:PAS domain-containing sensor histidine kinase [Mucilaginibacter sp. KACC 22063]|uniref:PAS domain-containing sensor histidine kinase n=1 Tax=Mucilaginibacter sp. KACC 22063 TaxID=3025666 RepID=UPI00236628B8|nr:PAS domain-containing sensor histidine kinase [Mucilaginibacter sp. KACC 22063]WDF54200.1 PAS domain-containing sensor histidine kinase [Mucilaginibacter sp. KACC 22063]
MTFSLADFEHFFYSSRDLFCIAGFDGYFKNVNSAVTDTLGYSLEELKAIPIDSFIFPDDRDITSMHRNRLHQTLPLYNFENRYMTKSGEVVWLAWTSVSVPEKELVFAVAKNITYRKRQEEDRNHLLKALTDQIAEMQNVAYSLAHDLRAPIGNLQLLLMLEEQPDIGLISATANELRYKLDSFLDMLIEKRKKDAQLEKLSLKESLNRIISSLQSLIADSGTSISCNFSGAADVWFNSSYLDSIFLNLITNSIKYTLPGKYPIISVSSRHCETFTEIIYTDNGRGFDMNKVGEQVFQFNRRFHTVTDSKGIGLYLVRNHLNSLGGDIGIQSSEPGKGTSFIIKIREPQGI